MKKNIKILLLSVALSGCGSYLAPLAENAIPPTVVTEQTPNDTDDPAVWINHENPEKSLIIGTDKEKQVGGLYAFDLNGKIVAKVERMDRPNNVDIAYGFNLGGKKVDIAVVTERKKDRLRIFSLPDLKPLDGRGIPVFEDSDDKKPMGIALYTSPISHKIYAIVSRKMGESGEYLYQYELYEANGQIKASLVRKFGTFSGRKEIEAIAVDNENGYIYYSDETVGIRKYYAEPSKGNEELSFFGTEDFKRDNEGIAIYKTNKKDGYLIISDQQRNHFNVYKREGEPGNPHQHELVASIPLSTIECDGADAINYNFGAPFEQGFLVAMSNGRVFHLYDWKIIQEAIDAYKK